MEILDDHGNPVQNVPVQQQPAEQTPVVSVGEWMLVMLILAIPLVNIVMLFVWAFGGGVNKTKANYCKASLIWIAIAIAMWIIFFSSIMGMMAGLKSAGQVNYSGIEKRGGKFWFSARFLFCRFLVPIPTLCYAGSPFAAGFMDTRTLSIRAASISTISKLKLRHESFSPVCGICSSSSRISPLSVL